MSIVGRGLGRKLASAALLVTAGFGLGVLVTTPPGQVYGNGRGADDQLSLQVARGERGSGGWWGYVKPAAAPEPAIAGPGLKVPRQALPPEAAPAPKPTLPIVLTPDQAAQLDALLPQVRTAEEMTMLLTMVLCAPPPAPEITLTTSVPPSDDELALLALLMAAETRH